MVLAAAPGSFTMRLIRSFAQIVQSKDKSDEKKQSIRNTWWGDEHDSIQK